MSPPEKSDRSYALCAAITVAASTKQIASNGLWARFPASWVCNGRVVVGVCLRRERGAALV